MSVAGWIVIGVMTVIGVIDWFIVMGTKPRNWKGGEKDDSRRTDRKV